MYSVRVCMHVCVKPHSVVLYTFGKSMMSCLQPVLSLVASINVSNGVHCPVVPIVRFIVSNVLATWSHSLTTVLCEKG